MPKPKIALIIGAGFSTEAGLPTTPGLSEHFLSLTGGADEDIEHEINIQLAEFWRVVFRYGDHTLKPPPLEDHFTLIDLAANTGHQLGPGYSPRRLRAIRRLSIHRVFQILDLRYRESSNITALLRRLWDDSDATIISTNWDVVVEKHLRNDGIPYSYGSTVEPLGVRQPPGKRLSLLKLHGSANWVYCDSCRTLLSAEPTEGKAALHLGAYLEPEDFETLKSSESVVARVKQITSGNARQCKRCQARLAARVGTFSYRKDYAIQQFQTIWHAALKKLRESDHWLFIGYSMPEADFEFKQILKTAELGRRRHQRPRVTVILKEDRSAADRYSAFFGVGSQIVQNGFSIWYRNEFDHWLSDK